MAANYNIVTYYCFIIFPIVIIKCLPKNNPGGDIFGQIQNMSKIVHCFYNES